MKYCSLCLQPDTRPNTVFADSGICPACIYFSSIDGVNWDQRFEIIKELVNKYGETPTREQRHDCILGVSGGKDSTRQALFLRDKVGVNPLLVCLSYPPDQVTQRGVNNLSNLIELGFDVIVSAPAPTTWKILKQRGFEQFTNSFRSTETALFSTVPQVAIRHGIKLIFWGESPALQLGDMKTLGATGFDGNNLRNMNTLSSGLSWILEGGLKESDVLPYIYPSTKEFEEHSLQIVYLGWFLGDWSHVNNAMYSALTGLAIRTDPVEKTGDLFGVTALDEDFTPINQLIKFYKYGFGRVTDYVNEEIRLNRMSRNEGIDLVTRYDGAYDQGYLGNYCDYLGITKAQFWSQVHSVVNQRLFSISQNGEIEPRFKVGVGL